MINEHSLIRRLREGDPAAFEIVVTQYYESVYRQLWLLCGDRDAAADLTQETFVQAWRSLSTFAGRSALRTWLHTIAVRTWRRSDAQDRLQLRSLLVDRESELEDALDSREGPVEVFEATALWAALDAALQQLPLAYREAVRLYCVDEMRYREIAEVLDVPIGTVKSRLHKGLRCLRAWLVSCSSLEFLEGKTPRL